jgi:hypothetical protein
MVLKFAPPAQRSAGLVFSAVVPVDLLIYSFELYDDDVLTLVIGVCLGDRTEKIEDYERIFRIDSRKVSDSEKAIIAATLDAIENKTGMSNWGYETNTNIYINYSGKKYELSYLASHDGNGSPIAWNPDFFELFQLVDTCGGVFDIYIDFGWVYDEYLNGGNEKAIFKVYNFLRTLKLGVSYFLES